MGTGPSPNDAGLPFSSKHEEDIRAIPRVMGDRLDRNLIAAEAGRRGLARLRADLSSTGP